MNENVLITSQPVLSDIQFRSKFESKIPEGMRERFVEAVSTVNRMPDRTALFTLWKLTYNPPETLHSLGFTTNVDYADNETLPFKGFGLISEELIIPLRNELRYQRTLVTPNFPEHSVSEKWAEAFEGLKNATGQDIITCVIILNKCNFAVTCFPDIEIERSIALLKSPLDNNLFGGIRNLRFNYDESNYLKPYAGQISALLTAMWEEKKLQTKPYTPMANLGELLEEKHFHFEETPAEVTTDVVEPDHSEKNEVSQDSTTDSIVIEEKNMNETASPSENSLQITARTILDNIEVLEDFLNAYKKLEEVGFNPSEVLSKIDAISNNLESIKALG